jgi:hypothetical protein
MSSLQETQAAFQDHVLCHDKRIVAQLLNGEKASTATLLAIYSDGYRLRLIEALAVHYPALQVILGDKVFHELGLAYVEANPSQHFSIRYYGHRLSAFLAEELPYSELPLLSELAKWEWALSGVFDAADAGLMTLEGMALIQPERWPGLCFALHPSVFRVEIAWNTVAIWKACDKKEDVPTPQLLPVSVSWLLWRHSLVTHFRPLAADEAWALGALACGRTFDHLCEGMCKWVSKEGVSVYVVALLKRWLVEGLITAVV